MPTIEVLAEPTPEGWECAVEVRGTGTATHHRVQVSRADLDRLAPGSDEPVALVRESFAFLLEREPKESILRAFELPLIGRYYPEYEREIASRMRSGLTPG